MNWNRSVVATLLAFSIVCFTSVSGYAQQFELMEKGPLKLRTNGYLKKAIHVKKLDDVYMANTPYGPIPYGVFAESSNNRISAVVQEQFFLRTDSLVEISISFDQADDTAYDSVASTVSIYWGDLAGVTQPTLLAAVHVSGVYVPSEGSGALSSNDVDFTVTDFGVPAFDTATYHNSDPDLTARITDIHFLGDKHSCFTLLKGPKVGDTIPPNSYFNVIAQYTADGILKTEFNELLVSYELVNHPGIEQSYGVGMRANKLSPFSCNDTIAFGPITDGTSYYTSASVTSKLADSAVIVIGISPSAQIGYGPMPAAQVGGQLEAFLQPNETATTLFYLSTIDPTITIDTPTVVHTNMQNQALTLPIEYNDAPINISFGKVTSKGDVTPIYHNQTVGLQTITDNSQGDFSVPPTELRFKNGGNDSLYVRNARFWGNAVFQGIPSKDPPFWLAPGEEVTVNVSYSPGTPDTAYTSQTDYILYYYDEFVIETEKGVELNYTSSLTGGQHQISRIAKAEQGVQNRTDAGLNVQLFPNPSTGVLQINSGSLHRVRYELYDPMGRMIAVANSTGGQYRWDVRNTTTLSNGTYFLRAIGFQHDGSEVSASNTIVIQQ
jgi:hypothetical protein